MTLKRIKKIVAQVKENQQKEKIQKIANIILNIKEDLENLDK